MFPSDADRTCERTAFLRLVGPKRDLPPHNAIILKVRKSEAYPGQEAAAGLHALRNVSPHYSPALWAADPLPAPSVSRF